jgi:hypothetical protein
MSSSSKRQVSNGDLEPTEKIRHLNTALIVSTNLKNSSIDYLINLEYRK